MYAVLGNLRLDAASGFSAIVDAARDTAPVSGLTHNFYRYPARSSPKFVRSIIERFSVPGDLVVDPFVGGGTTLVEALALGREGVGFDISSLATFITEVKTTVFANHEVVAVERWADCAHSDINMHEPSTPSLFYHAFGYYRNINTVARWRHRKAIEQALSAAIDLPPRSQALARCIILRTAQWALDGRRNLPTIAEFRGALGAFAAEMLEGARELRLTVKVLPDGKPMPVHRVNRPAGDLPEYFDAKKLRKPALILTSPPYPGIHVLYHRWQVDGRKETPAPFWIANKLDGSGSSYYTMGDRKYPELASYFSQLKTALMAIAAVCDEQTVIVQVVGFSDPSWQLEQYLATSAAAGLEELRSPLLAGERDGRLWRSVPNRKWHADQLGDIPASREVVLFHRRTP
ncbi:MAG: DNA methyltransferase [Stellaceae bacterium]